MKHHNPHNKTLMASFSIIYITLFILIYAAANTTLDLRANTGREKLILHQALKSDLLLLQFFFFAFLNAILAITPLIILIKSTRITGLFLNLRPFYQALYFFISLISMWVLILSINQEYYPLSKYSFLIPALYDDKVRNILKHLSSLTLTLMVVFPLAAKTALTIRHIINKKTIITLSVLAFLPIFILLFATNKTNGSPKQKPNIIFIGLDSVSPLHLQHNPNDFKFLRGLLNSGVNFQQSITPLARTFPAWTSILTGKYPIHNGARFNLVPIEEVNKQTFLSTILQTHGYTTIYAQDERKFNNLDETFGFDKVIGPSVGASEFILTRISDTPFLNIFLLLPFSDHFFPQITYNRADYIHYSPTRFVKHIVKNLPGKSTPLFLSVHFCLVHYPYKWRDRLLKKQFTRIDSGHKMALSRVQNQIKQLLEALKKGGYLNNALLVILSDHGESMAYRDGLWLDTRKGSQEDKNNILFDYVSGLKSGYAGHGTNILDKTQYTTLLSFKTYGKLKNTVSLKPNNQIASLVDIMPTVLSLIDIPTPADLDGWDLLGNDTSQINTRKIVLAETGITFRSLLSMDKFNETSLLIEAAKYYTVSPKDARIVIKKDRIPELIKTKQYAVHTDNWILAFIRPIILDKKLNGVILIHKPTGKWTLGGNKNIINEAPINLLKSYAEKLLGGEIKEFSTYLSNFKKTAELTTPENP